MKRGARRGDGQLKRRREEGVDEWERLRIPAVGDVIVDPPSKTWMWVSRP